MFFTFQFAMLRQRLSLPNVSIITTPFVKILVKDATKRNTVTLRNRIKGIIATFCGRIQAWDSCKSNTRWIVPNTVTTKEIALTLGLCDISRAVFSTTLAAIIRPNASDRKKSPGKICSSVAAKATTATVNFRGNLYWPTLLTS